MKSVVICGKERWGLTAEEMHKQGFDVWCCGTESRDGADLYVELHGIKVNRDNVLYELPEEVYLQGLPVNNTISALLIFAYLKGYTNIAILGAPMTGSDEYIEQRSGVAWVCGWLEAKGIIIDWKDKPVNVNYGRKNWKN